MRRQVYPERHVLWVPGAPHLAKHRPPPLALLSMQMPSPQLPESLHEALHKPPGKPAPVEHR
jgi:hypothetical protein